MLKMEARQARRTAMAVAVLLVGVPLASSAPLLRPLPWIAAALFLGVSAYALFVVGVLMLLLACAVTLSGLDEHVRTRLFITAAELLLAGLIRSLTKLRIGIPRCQRSYLDDRKRHRKRLAFVMLCGDTFTSLGPRRLRHSIARSLRQGADLADTAVRCVYQYSKTATHCVYHLRRTAGSFAACSALTASGVVAERHPDHGVLLLATTIYLAVVSHTSLLVFVALACVFLVTAVASYAASQYPLSDLAMLCAFTSIAVASGFAIFQLRRPRTANERRY